MNRKLTTLHKSRLPQKDNLHKAANRAKDTMEIVVKVAGRPGKLSEVKKWS